MAGKTQVQTILQLAVFSSCVPVSHDPKTEAAKWISTIIYFIIDSCAVQNAIVHAGKREWLPGTLKWN